MSYATEDLREIVDLLREIKQLLADVQNQANSPQTGKLVSTFRDLERLALRYLTIARRIGLPDDVDRSISLVMRLIVIIRMAQMSMNLFMASNPVTMLIGVAGFATTALSAVDLGAGY